jgi:DNA mismatch repair protein MutS
VAQLAGVPASVIHAARTRLAQLENGQMISAGEGRTGTPVQPPAQADLFSMPFALEQQLAELDPDNMSPRDALQALYQLKALHQDV